MNESLFLLLHGFAGKSPVFDGAFVFFAEKLGPLMLLFFLLMPFVLRIHEKRETWLWMAFIAASAIIARFGLTEIIRSLYPTARPFVVMPEIMPLIQHPPTNSFPSGHAVFYFALAAGVFLWMRDILPSETRQKNKKLEQSEKLLYYFRYRVFRTTIVALYLIGALLIGLGRIVVGVHWPYDIGAGVIVAIATVYGLYMLVRKWLPSDATIV